jgi:hypothetical protein
VPKSPKKWAAHVCIDSHFIVGTWNLVKPWDSAHIGTCGRGATFMSISKQWDDHIGKPIKGNNALVDDSYVTSVKKQINGF